MPDVVLTGLPRSGSTLTCHLLNLCADTVALHEPMPIVDFARQNSPAGLIDRFERFYADTRRSLLESRTAPSKVVAGRVPDNTFGDDRGAKNDLRLSRASHGEVTFEGKPLTTDFTLAIKHNAGFAAALDLLVDRFPCYGIVRHPLAVLASWNSVRLPVQKGHIPAGEEIDPKLRAALEGIDDRTERQFYILEWFFERFGRLLPASSILRYEVLIATGGRSLAAVTPGAAELAEPLASKNANAAYNAATMYDLGRRLLGREGAWWQFYTPRECRGDAGRHRDPGGLSLATCPSRLNSWSISSSAALRKPGTSALTQFLSSHPEICLAKRKEAHFFDWDDFSDDADPGEIRRRYRQAFPDEPHGQVAGEATPVYMYLPWVPERIRRYNPAMKWIVLLRDPVERALSHYHMQFGLGLETRPLASALRLERDRLRRDRLRTDWKSSLRCHSYVSRGLYSGQIARLWKLFSKQQVFILTSEQLRDRHRESLRAVHRFLGVNETADLPEPETVFATENKQPVPKRARTWLRRRFRSEIDRLEVMLGRSLDTWREDGKNA